MALLNPGFEDEGASLGLAEHWTLTSLTALQGIAGFGPSPYRAREDFERWTDLQGGFGDGDRRKINPGGAGAQAGEGEGVCAHVALQM